MNKLDKQQIEVFRAVGRDIARGWQEACDGELPEMDYGFGAQGDYELVEDTARDGGVAADEEVWDAVTEGYQEYIREALAAAPIYRPVTMETVEDAMRRHCGYCAPGGCAKPRLRGWSS